MKKTILTFLAILFIAACSKEETPQQDPLIGKWYLKQFYRNDSIQVLDECSLMKNIEFYADGYYKEEYYKRDTITNICISNGTSGYKWSEYNGQYILDNGSVFNQELQIKLQNNKLFYTYEGWRFTANGIVSSQMKLVYQK